MRKLQIKTLMLGIIIGGIIFGSIGIVATNYLLKAEDVEYIDKDNNTMTVQSAITDLYSKASSGGYGELTLGTVTKTHNSITIPYTGNYQIVGCIYGTGNSNSYGNYGTINGNTCNITGLQSETPYDYKIIAVDSTGKVYEGHGTIETDEGTGPIIVTTGIPTGTVGVVYLDPTDLNASCDANNSVSTTGTKTGCMKWYVYKLENGNYTMILDHNTTAGVAYNTTNSNENHGTTSGNVGYDLALLTASTSSGGSGWIVTPRLISVDEIASIVGNTSWNSASNTDWFYFDSKNQTQTATSQGASAYAWLFDYTFNCTSYGCNTADWSNYGYWTSSKYFGDSSFVWLVFYYGTLSYYNADSAGYGLRPVITISSSALSLG